MHQSVKRGGRVAIVSRDGKEEGFIMIALFLAVLSVKLHVKAHCTIVSISSCIFCSKLLRVATGPKK